MYVRWPRIPLSTAKLGFVGEVLASVVATQDDVLARRVRPSSDRDASFEVELVGVCEDVPGEEVELTGFSASAGKHQRDAVGAQRVPVSDRSLHRSDIEDNESRNSSSAGALSRR
jgi:hypothetical protein